MFGPNAINDISAVTSQRVNANTIPVRVLACYKHCPYEVAYAAFCNLFAMFAGYDWNDRNNLPTIKKAAKQRAEFRVDFLTRMARLDRRDDLLEQQRMSPLGLKKAAVTRPETLNDDERWQLTTAKEEQAAQAETERL
jgi:hypothetical protein